MPALNDNYQPPSAGVAKPKQPSGIGPGLPFGTSALIPSALSGAQQQYSDSLARQQYGLGMQGLGLSQQGLGLQRQDIAQQLAFLAQQYGLQQQGFGLTQQGFGLQSAELSNEEKQARRSYGENLESFMGGQAARGAIGTKGTGTGRGDIANQLSQQLFGVGQGRKRLGLEEKQFGLSKKEAALTYKMRQAQLQRGSKQLDLEAKRLGLDATRLKDQLQNALAQSGLGALMDVYDLGNMLGSKELGQSQAAYSILYSALQPMFTQTPGQ